MRRPGFATPGFLIIAILLLVSFAGARPALAFQEASPAAGTPAPAPQPTQAPAPAETPAATPAAPAAPAQTDVVTLVLWYNNPVDQELIDLFPLSTDPAFVASPAQGAAAVGTVDFPVDGVTPPSVVVGDTTFEAYPRPDGVIERWTWLDDFEGARPGTLVMQLAGISGQYQNYFGTGTFISRDEGGAGGVLILAQRPPNPVAVAEEEAAATAQPAEEAAAETTDAAAEADTGIVIEGEAAAEGEAPAA